MSINSISMLFGFVTLTIGFAGKVFADELPSTVASGAKLEQVFGDERFFEGPTWDPKTGKLYFTAFGDATQVLRLDEPGKAVVWMDKSQGVNGTYLDNEGRLLGAQGEAKKILSMAVGLVGPEDTRTLYHQDTPMNPNDICQTLRGDIYFTLPDFAEKKRSTVMRIDTDGNASTVITEMTLPNGIIASLDGKTLYVADSHEKHWRSYPINEDGSLGEGKVFFDPDTENKSDPDGMSIDEQGNLYLTGRGGVWVVSPEGKSLGLIPVPEFVSNCSFGDADGKTLYLTCAKKVYRLKMNVRGRQK
jgi:gluconolactonase